MAESTLGISFDTDYWWFVKRYGGAMVYELAGLRVADHELYGADQTVVNETLRFRRTAEQSTKDWLIVSNDGWGNHFGITTGGRVQLSDHETGAVVDIADSFEEFLLMLFDGRPFG